MLKKEKMNLNKIRYMLINGKYRRGIRKMILNINDLTYISNDSEIWKGISLDVEQGDCISIIGQSGSGKSTLLKLCADLLPISSGNMYFRGKSYLDYNPIELRKEISYCIQMPQLFGKSVYENLEFPFKVRHEQVDRERIIQLLEAFNLNEHILDNDIHSLSGGEKQRVSIIRNLIYTPDILLLDEATSALDAENTKVIEAYIQALNQSGMTVIWVTHSLSQSEGIFNKRLTLSEGKVECMEVL